MAKLENSNVNWKIQM